MAEEERVFESGVVRLMFRAHQRKRSEEDFLRLQRELAPRAKAVGVASEADVERLVLDDR